MGVTLFTYEVEVVVERGNYEYKPLTWYGKAEWTRNKQTKMFIIENVRDHNEAMKKAQKYGKLMPS
ncbi:MAG: hypothetical protein RLY18_1407 [Pseudomonadota bacterium]